MFRPRRQQRYNFLKDRGFLPFEAFALSREPIKVWRTIPYARELLKERRRELMRLKKQGLGKEKTRKGLMKNYVDKDWYTKDRGKIKLDPWKMFRDFEEQFKKEHPEYVTPMLKRRRKRIRIGKAFREGLGKRGLEL